MSAQIHFNVFSFFFYIFISVLVLYSGGVEKLFFPLATLYYSRDVQFSVDFRMFKPSILQRMNACLSIILNKILCICSNLSPNRKSFTRYLIILQLVRRCMYTRTLWHLVDIVLSKLYLSEIFTLVVRTATYLVARNF